MPSKLALEQRAGGTRSAAPRRWGSPVRGRLRASTPFFPSARGRACSSERRRRRSESVRACHSACTCTRALADAIVIKKRAPSLAAGFIRAARFGSLNLCKLNASHASEGLPAQRHAAPATPQLVVLYRVHCRTAVLTVHTTQSGSHFLAHWPLFGWPREARALRLCGSAAPRLPPDTPNARRTPTNAPGSPTATGPPWDARRGRRPAGPAHTPIRIWVSTHV